MRNSFRGKKVDAGMPMLFVVPTEEALANRLASSMQPKR